MSDPIEKARGLRAHVEKWGWTHSDQEWALKAIEALADCLEALWGPRLGSHINGKMAPDLHAEARRKFEEAVK